MAQLLVIAETVPTDVVDSLASIGFTWKAVSSVEVANAARPESGWVGALVLGNDPETAFAICRQLRQDGSHQCPILVALPQIHIAAIDVANDLFDDFILMPDRGGELVARLRLMTWQSSGTTGSELVEYGALVLNLSTYQAEVAGRPLDMTYMEYELLKHFATNPGRVLTRQELLRQVWGYEYYGGARTVDVHVRRLRAKLGDEHAQLIQTVRSVGYIFGRQKFNDIV